MCWRAVRKKGLIKKRVDIGHGQRLMRDERLGRAAQELRSLLVTEGGENTIFRADHFETENIVNLSGCWQEISRE